MNPKMGLNFYLTKYDLRENPFVDYSEVNMDTIALEIIPFISYSNISYYDTTANNQIILGLNTSKNNINFAGNARMFVAKWDDRPVFLGFLWSINFSKRSNWIIIEDPFEHDGLKVNELRILANPITHIYVTDRYFLEQLKTDKKLR
ncbi:MAG: hypothetical protein HC905_30515 [Bacteroidales bacterium]|nr:hypothetical protein [Bacteroidales bacterium]